MLRMLPGPRPRIDTWQTSTWMSGAMFVAENTIHGMENRCCQCYCRNISATDVFLSNSASVCQPLAMIAVFRAWEPACLSRHHEAGWVQDFVCCECCLKGDTVLLWLITVPHKGSSRDLCPVSEWSESEPVLRHEQEGRKSMQDQDRKEKVDVSLSIRVAYYST